MHTLADHLGLVHELGLVSVQGLVRVLGLVHELGMLRMLGIPSALCDYHRRLESVYYFRCKKIDNIGPRFPGNGN